MVDYQTLSIVLTGIGMVIALTYYGLQIRNQNTTRQAQLFMQTYNKFTDRDFQRNFQEIVFQWKWDDYDDFWEKYGPETNSEESSKRGSVLRARNVMRILGQ